jgi:hypothetical protein
MQGSSCQFTIRAASELESIRSICKHEGVDFPLACRRLLMSLPGNSHCVDCCMPNPEWASITYGTLICMRCSGIHRSYGVQTSFVRSIRMDTWSHAQILAMLEGGNRQLQGFFDRHEMGMHSALAGNRYHTKAARFYKVNLKKHVETVAKSGVYKGRDASRTKHKREEQTSYVVG